MNADKVVVSRKDIEYIASFNCEWVTQTGKEDQHCDLKDGERGACCNSCWARRWAKGQLSSKNEGTMNKVECDVIIPIDKLEMVEKRINRMICLVTIFSLLTGLFIGLGITGNL
jgi:hypothetical protein